MSDPEKGAAIFRRMAWSDPGLLHPVLEETGLFPPDLLDGMAGEAFDDPARFLWLMAEARDGPDGPSYGAPALRRGVRGRPGR